MGSTTTHRTRGWALRSALGWAALAATFLGCTFSGGCKKALFSQDEARSQFDRFDAVRDKRAEPFVFDEFGQRRPNIRSRLLTRE